MTVKRYRVELAGDEQGLSASIARVDAALARQERQWGTLAQQMARTGREGVALRSAQEASARGADSLAGSLTRLGAAGTAMGRQQADAVEQMLRTARASGEQAQAVARLRAAAEQAPAGAGNDADRRLAAAAAQRRAAQAAEVAELQGHLRTLEGLQQQHAQRLAVQGGVAAARASAAPGTAAVAGGGAQAAAAGELAQQLQLVASASQRVAREQQQADTQIARTTQGAVAQQQALARLQASLGGAAQLGGVTEQQRLEVVAGLREAAFARDRAAQQRQQQALEGIRSAALARERDQYRAQQQFLESLNRSVVADEAVRSGKSARAALLEMQAAQLGVADKARPMIQRLAEADARFQNFGKSGRLSALQLQQVGFQLNDLAVQLASGQNPITALVQQGSQLSGTFGGVRPALAALASLVTPARLAIGGLAGGVLALGAAWVQGYRESRQFNDALAVTGNFAGQTAGSFERLVGTVSQLGDVSRGSARDALAQVVGSGRFGPENVDAVATAVVRLQKFTGQSTEQILQSFSAITGGVARWAAEQNRAYNFLTPKVYEQIRALEAQGRTQEAIGVAVTALNEKFAGQSRNLGFLERAYESTKKAVGDFWDTLKGLGRDETPEQQLERLNKRLAELQAGAEGARRAGFRQPRQDAERQAVESERNAAAKRLMVQQDDAALAARNAEDNQREIERLGVAHQAAQAAIERAGAQQRLALAEVTRDRELGFLRDSWDRQLLDADAFVTARVAIERDYIAAKERALDEEIAIEKRRTVLASTTDVEQQRARLIEFQTRRIQLNRERSALAERASRGELRPDRRDEDNVDRVQQDVLRRLEQWRERNEETLDRLEEGARRAAEGLLETNRDLAVSLIRDDRARGQAQIAIEAEQQRRRIDLQLLSADERARAEDSLARYIQLREQQLTEQLKPEWQRQAEAYEDIQRRRRDVNDEFNLAFVQGGREAFGQLLATGKLSFDNLAQYALRVLGEQAFERLGLARSFAQLGDLVFGGIDAALSARGAGGGDAQPSAERDVLRQLEAAAATQIAQMAAGTAADAADAAATTAQTTATVGATTALAALTTVAVQPATVAMGGAAVAANTLAAALAAAAASSGGAGILEGLFGVGDGGGMGFPFARGGVLQGGVAQRFARGALFGRGGALIERPTVFPMRRGLGLAGEAGPEAVMPLRKLPDGKLGVGAQGTAPVVQMQVEIVNNTPARVRTEQRADGRLRVLIDEVEGALGQRIDNGVGLAGNIGNRFGLNGGAGLIL